MEVRLIKDDEIAAVNELHNAAYGTARSLEQWRWEFDRPVARGLDRPFAVAVDGDRVVGSQALIPVAMIDRGGVYPTAKSEETLVDPEYRGQKLLERMYDVLKEYALKHDIRYIWGFTPADRAFRKVGFKTPRKTEQLFFPFSSRAVGAVAGTGSMPRSQLNTGIRGALTRAAVGSARIYSSLQATGLKGRTDRVCERYGFTLRTLTAPPEQAGQFCERFVERWGGTTIYRDTEYLQWRIFDNPYLKPVFRTVWSDERLLGWVAYAVGDQGIGYIVDLMVALPEKDSAAEFDITRLLLSEAVLGLKATGALGIRGWRVNDHPFDRTVCRAARSVGFWHIRRGYMVVVLDQPGGEFTDDDNWFDSWYVSRIYTEGLAG